MSFLERILPGKEAEAGRLRALYAQRAPERPSSQPVRDFEAALNRPLAVIAEVKQRSPSHPHFKQTASPARLARAYRRGGAAALSVVTDEAHFGTSLKDVRVLREASGLPVLVKDFIVDRSQILAAWEAGADAVLLIARLLDQKKLTELLTAVHDLGLAALVECHDEADIAISLAAGARIIGINNRNLATLTTDIEQTSRLLPLLPAGVISISESGLESREQLERLAAAGASAFLIGHALLMNRDPGRKIRELTGREQAGRLRAKVCGLVVPADAVACHQLGVDLLGVIFASSARQISVIEASDIRKVVPEARLCGVFRDAPLEDVVYTSEQCDLDLLQLHGDESPDYCVRLSERTGLPLIKTITLGRPFTAAIEDYSAVAYLMVDLPKDESFRDSVLQKEDLMGLVRACRATGREVFLAGGLNPGNVGEALPEGLHAVDVCSGVESVPCRKDLVKVKAFLQGVRR